MLLIGDPVALVGSVVSYESESMGGPASRLSLEIGSRTGVGDALIELPNINGILSRVYITPATDAYAPAANWTVKIYDSYGGSVFDSGAITAYTPWDGGAPMAGTYRLFAQLMGTSGERRAKITLAFSETDVEL